MMRVDECPAGPAMDAAVARALGLDVVGIIGVFPNPECGGYFYVGYDIEGDIPRPVYLDGCACEFKEPDDKDYFGHHAGCLGVVHRYSADVAAAWGLVEVMQSELSNPWAIFCKELNNGVKLLRGKAKGDAPLAICRAFLKARGVGEVGT